MRLKATEKGKTLQILIDRNNPTDTLNRVLGVIHDHVYGASHCQIFVTNLSPQQFAALKESFDSKSDNPQLD